MTIHQRRALLRRIDLFLCKLLRIEPGPDPYPAPSYIVRFLWTKSSKNYGRKQQQIGPFTDGKHKGLGPIAGLHNPVAHGLKQ